MQGQLNLVYTKTADSFEDALGLTTHTSNVLCVIHLRATCAEFLPESIPIFEGINELKPSFCSHCFSVHFAAR